VTVVSETRRKYIPVGSGPASLRCTWMYECRGAQGCAEATGPRSQKQLSQSTWPELRYENWCQEPILSPPSGVFLRGSRTEDFFVRARSRRTDECRDARGRATHGAVAENRSVYVVPDNINNSRRDVIHEDSSTAPTTLSRKKARSGCP